MSLPDRYCVYCGKKLKIVISRYYNRETGKKEYMYASCGIWNCVHGIHKYKWNWRKFKITCIYCGKILL